VGLDGLNEVTKTNPSFFGTWENVYQLMHCLKDYTGYVRSSILIRCTDLHEHQAKGSKKSPPFIFVRRLCSTLYPFKKRGAEKKVQAKKREWEYER
jgi:hypothetical protein